MYLKYANLLGNLYLEQIKSLLEQRKSYLRYSSGDAQAEQDRLMAKVQEKREAANALLESMRAYVALADEDFGGNEGTTHFQMETELFTQAKQLEAPFIEDTVMDANPFYFEMIKLNADMQTSSKIAKLNEAAKKLHEAGDEDYLDVAFYSRYNTARFFMHKDITFKDALTYVASKMESQVSYRSNDWYINPDDTTNDLYLTTVEREQGFNRETVTLGQFYEFKGDLDYLRFWT